MKLEGNVRVLRSYVMIREMHKEEMCGGEFYREQLRTCAVGYKNKYEKYELSFYIPCSYST